MLLYPQRYEWYTQYYIILYFPSPRKKSTNFLFVSSHGIFKICRFKVGVVFQGQYFSICLYWLESVVKVKTGLSQSLYFPCIINPSRTGLCVMTSLSFSFLCLHIICFLLTFPSLICVYFFLGLNLYKQMLCFWLLCWQITLILLAGSDPPKAVSCTLYKQCFCTYYNCTSNGRCVCWRLFQVTLRLKCQFIKCYPQGFSLN